MITVITGLSGEAARQAIQIILAKMHNHGIHYDLWSWWIAAEGILLLTDGEGNVVSETAANIQLLNTEAVMTEVDNNGLLEDISAAISGVPVWTNMARMEAAYDDKRL